MRIDIEIDQIVQRTLYNLMPMKIQVIDLILS